jgi:branched-chain amino acid transport system permease protein
MAADRHCGTAVMSSMTTSVAPAVGVSRSSWTRASIGFVIAEIAGCLIAWLASPLSLSLALQATIEAIFAVSIGFFVRQLGRVSFGHAAFYGVAAYLMALLLKNTSWSGELVVLTALAVPTVLAFLMGLLIARIPGVAHAMITLAIGQAVYEVLYKWRELTNGDDGVSASLPKTLFGFDSAMFQHGLSMFLICWTALLLILVGLMVVVRSPFGQLTEAIRENAKRAQFLGYAISQPRAINYAISGFVASCAGVLFFLYNGFVSPGLLHWSWSGTGLIMAIIGGPMLLWGPAFGAFIYFVIKETAGDATELWPAIVGGVLIAVTVWMPQGTAPTLMTLWGRVWGVRSDAGP